ncbi:MAG: glycosyltransferase family 4 protein [Acidimicrobiales bacterium]
MPVHQPALRIRLVTWDDDPPVGGQGVYVRELRASLIDRGIVVDTLAGHGPFAASYPRVTGIGHIDLSVALNISTRQLLEAGPDIVHVSGGPGGIQLLRSLPVPLVYTAHHTYAQSHRRWSLKHGYGAIEARGYRHASMVAAVSPSTARSLLAMGVRPSRVTVISPGIRIDESAAGIDGDGEPGRILFVGRLEAEKGPLDAIRAMRRVTEEVPGAHGHVVGSGSLEPAVRDMIDACGTRQITFLGRLSDEEVSRELRQSQIVLVPSAFEGLGMVALEAMAAGSAVVGYDVAGLHDTVGAHGVLVPHGDWPGLAAACGRLLTDGPFRSDLVAEALDTVRRERSWARCARQFDELYRVVLASG